MRTFYRLITRQVVTVTLGFLTIAPVAHAESVFVKLGGNWVGSGTIELSDGSSERLRCRASYRVGGERDSVQQSLRCASDALRFDISSDVVNQEGRVSGTWNEMSRNVSGSLQGRASEGRIYAIVDAPGFSANLTIIMRGDRQSVNISSQGEIRNISVTLVRS